MFRLKREEEEKFIGYVKEHLAHPLVQSMKDYKQHGAISTFDHCMEVAKKSFLLNKRLHLHADEEALSRGALLHDFYLYDWHNEDDGSHKWHGFFHAGKALENAKQHFDISELEQDIIKNHMWPLTLRHIPKSREAAIVCFVDKCVSLRETLFNRRKGA